MFCACTVLHEMALLLTLAIILYAVLAIICGPVKLIWHAWIQIQPLLTPDQLNNITNYLATLMFICLYMKSKLVMCGKMGIINPHTMHKRKDK